MKKSLKLSAKLVTIVLLTSGLVSLASSSLQVFWEYRSDLGDLDTQILQVEAGYSASLSSAVWAFDESQIYTIIQGIKALPSISYVRVKTDFKEFEVGQQPTSQAITKTIKLNADDYPVGTLEIKASLTNIYNKLWTRFLVILGSNAIKAFITSLILIALFNRIITRHIIKIKDFFNLYENNPDSELPTPDRNFEPFGGYDDEVSNLYTQLEKTVFLLNRSRSKILTELHKRQVAEKQLQSINTNLESEVERRASTIKKQQATISNLATLNSLAEMAGGIAHEINNPLAIIDGHANNLLMDLKSGKSNEEKSINSIKKISSTVARIAEIIEHLRSLARDASGDPLLYENIKNVINAALDLNKAQIKEKGIAIIDEFNDKEFKLTLCKKSQLGQVVHHILQNAREAALQSESRFISISVDQDSEFTYIKIADSGEKISSEVQAKMFLPFYTTKEFGTTGLGLSISQRVVIDHGGEISYEEDGDKKFFQIKLPNNGGKVF